MISDRNEILLMQKHTSYEQKRAGEHQLGDKAHDCTGHTAYDVSIEHPSLKPLETPQTWDTPPVLGQYC